MTAPARNLEVPNGLIKRGKVYSICKRIGGKRFQESTGCEELEDALKVFQKFINEHTPSVTAGAGRRLVTGKPKLMKGLYWKGNVIWLSRTVDGVHHNISTGTSDVKLAEQFLADFNLKAFKGEKLGVANRKKITFENLANRSIEDGRMHGLREQSLKRYSAVRDHFQNFLIERRLSEADVAAISASNIDEFKSWRMNQPVTRNGVPLGEGEVPDTLGVKPKTLQFEVQTVGTFLRYGVRVGLIEKNPVSSTRPVKVSEAAPIYLDENEIKAFLGAAAKYDEWAASRQPFGMLIHDILLTYLKTGMRLEELRNLEWTDLSLEECEIAVRQEKEVTNSYEVPLTAGAVEDLQKMGKSGFDQLTVAQRSVLLSNWRLPEQSAKCLKYSDFDLKRGVLKYAAKARWNPKTTGRNIPISEGLKAVILRQSRTSNFVFANPVTGGMWRFKINRIIQQVAEHAKIKKAIHTHSLRHSFATHLRRKKVALETIKELLGHADIRDTLIYAHFSQEEARAAIPEIDFF